MFYPSICIADSGIRDAIYLGGLKLQTGQWVHDLLTVGRVINCAEIGTTILWRWEDETFLSFNARFKDFVDRFGYRSPKKVSRPMEQITEQQSLFGDLPIPSSPSPIGEVASFKKNCAGYSKLMTRVKAHRFLMEFFARSWLENSGYGIGARSVDLLKKNGSRINRVGRIAFGSDSGLLNSGIGKGSADQKIAAYNFQKN